MAARPGYSTVPLGGQPIKNVKDAASTSWVRKIAETVNNLLSGRMNVVLQITLRAGQTTTQVIDARIGAFSALILVPMTTHAAAALYSATSVIADPTTRVAGSVTFDHPNSANIDQTFNLVIIG